MRAVAGPLGRLFLFVLGVLAALAATQLDDLAFDHNTRSLLREDAAADAREDALVRSFGSEDLLLVAWEVSSALDPDEFDRLERVSLDLAAVEGLEETYSLATGYVQLRLGGRLRRIERADLASPEGRAEVREALLAATPYLGTIYNAGLDVVGVAGTVKPGRREEKERTVRAVREIARRHEQPGRPIHVAGVTALAMEAGEYAVSDMKRIGLLAFAVSVAVLLVLCRSLVETLVAVVATGLPPLLALAGAVAAGLPVTALGAALFPVMAVVGITGSVHILNAYGEARRGGASAAEAAVGAASRLAAPTVLSFLTTAFAFASLQATGVPAFRAGGYVVAIGMLVAVPVLLVGVPASLAWLSPMPHDRPSRLRQPLGSAARWALRRRRAVAGGALALCAAGAWLLPLAPLRVDVLQAFQPRSGIARTYAFLEDRLTATIPVDLVLSARPEAGPEAVLRDLERFESRARSAGVAHSLSLATLVEFGRRASPMEIGDAGALLFLRTFFAPITRRFEDAGARRYRVKMRVRDGSPPELLDRLAEGARECAAGQAELAGLYVRAVGTARQLVRDLGRSALVMAVVVLATLSISLRSLRIGLAAIVPNLLPPAVVFGVASACGVALDVSAVAVGSVSIGLAVDNTLHVAFRLAEERRRGLPLEEALPEAERTVGRALVLSTAVLAAGLGCLALSSFKPTAHFGLLTAMSTLVALPGDLLVFPAFARLLRAL